jgi:hypothetical protein
MQGVVVERALGKRGGTWSRALIIGALGAMAIICVSLALSARAYAAGSSRAGETASSRARHRALEIYTRHRAQPFHLGRWRHAAARAHAAVVGGVQVSISQVPWQVAVFAEFEFEGERFGLLCGGSIVDSTHIVTAGHCAYNPATESPLTSASFVILAGASNITAEEIKYGATVEARLVDGVRIHPDFNYRAGPGTPDDVAVLQLALPLSESAGVRPIALPASVSSPPQGTSAVLSGFGEENPTTEELNAHLYSLNTTFQFSGSCGREADAVFLCGSNPAGSACNGDSGGGVVNGSPSTLVGVVDTVQLVEGRRCRQGAIDGFVNVTAPEVRDFITGSENPPLAPRGGGVAIRGVTMAGHSLSCEPGSWSGGPAFTYAFVDSANSQVLQQGASSTYALTSADVGRTILCEVQAANAGGTGVVRTVALPAIQAAPPPPPPPAPTPTPTPTPMTPTVSSPPPTPGGGVLGYKSVSPNEVAAVLGRLLAPTGKGAKIAALLKARGFTFTFTAPAGGTVILDWYYLPPGAKLAKRTKVTPVLVASGQMTLSSEETARIKVKLSEVGRRLLSHARSLKLSVKAEFTPEGEAPVVASKVVVLRR